MFVVVAVVEKIMAERRDTCSGLTLSASFVKINFPSSREVRRWNSPRLSGVLISHASGLPFLTGTGIMINLNKKDERDKQMNYEQRDNNYKEANKMETKSKHDR